jgi:hypothetical protein
MGRRYLGKSLSLQSRSAEAARYGRLYLCSNNYNIQKLLSSRIHSESASMCFATHGSLLDIIWILETPDPARRQRPSSFSLSIAVEPWWCDGIPKVSGYQNLQRALRDGF